MNHLPLLLAELLLGIEATDTAVSLLSTTSSDDNSGCESTSSENNDALHVAAERKQFTR
jgi:hypothetical protein